MREFDAVDLFSIANESNSVTAIRIFWLSRGQIDASKISQLKEKRISRYSARLVTFIPFL